MKYKKKPIIIDAVKWEGLLEPLGCFGAPLEICLYPLPSITIKTLEGDMICNIGDYIIKGVKGELYPCKPDIFELTYELTEETVFEEQQFDPIKSM